MRSGKVAGKREGVGVAVGARARLSSSGDSSRKGAGMGSRIKVEGGVGERDGDGLALGGGEEGVSVPSHPVRASIKIRAQAEVYIVFFTIDRMKTPSLW